MEAGNDAVLDEADPEPLPSITSHPNATSNFSIARHSIVAETGSAKIARSVFAWLIFMPRR